MRAVIAGLLAAALVLLHADNVAAQDDYLLGVFPFDPPALIRKSFAPVVAEFASAVGRKVKLRTGSSFDDFSAELADQRYDIAYVEPFDFVAAEDRGHYLPLARLDAPIIGLLVALEGRSATVDPSLRTGLVATPPHAAAVSRLFWAALTEQGLGPGARVTGHSYRTHSACLHAILIRDAGACVTAPAPLRLFQRRTGERTRELFRTAAIPGPLFAVHRRVPAQRRATLRALILSWGNTSRGREILSSLGHTAPFIPVRDGEYDVVRRMLSNDD